MRITKKSIILLAFSVILMVLGLWNYVDANPVTYDVIASSVVLIVVGWTLLGIFLGIRGKKLYKDLFASGMEK